MGMVSMPQIRIRAQRKRSNPSMDRVTRLLARWSGSMSLFGYFDWRISIGKPLSACMLTMAVVLAALLSRVIFSGTW